MNLDDQICLVQADLQALVVPGQLGDERSVRPGGIGLGAALARCQRRKVGGLTLTAPSGQRGRIDTFTAQQSTDLAGLRASVHGHQNAAFGGVEKIRRRACGTTSELMAGATGGDADSGASSVAQLAPCDAPESARDCTARMETFG